MTDTLAARPASMAAQPSAAEPRQDRPRLVGGGGQEGDGRGTDGKGVGHGQAPIRLGRAAGGAACATAWRTASSGEA